MNDDSESGSDGTTAAHDTPSGGTRRAADALTGRLLAERYRVERTVSAGAHAVIVDATDTQVGRLVTVKLIRPEFSEVADFQRRFDETMQVTSMLSHPNIAAVHGWGKTTLAGRTTCYVVVEHLTGGSLRDLFDRGRHLTPSQALVVGLEACRALDEAHRRYLVHTELTPSKLVFGEDRRLRVIDFGLARLLGILGWSDPSTLPTHTARYASPEQAQRQQLDGKTDVYTLALTLTEAVTGRVPFSADSTAATLNARIGKLMPVSADLGSLAAVLERAGRAEREDRYSAAEFGRALVRAAEMLPRPEPIPVVVNTLFSDPPSRLPGDPTGGLERPSVTNGSGTDEPAAAPVGDDDAPGATAPEQPVIAEEPAGAAEPTAAGDTAEPTDPAAVVEPTDPAAVVEATDPAAAVEPTDPAAGVGPTEQADASDPAVDADAEEVPGQQPERPADDEPLAANGHAPETPEDIAHADEEPPDEPAGPGPSEDEGDDESPAAPMSLPGEPLAVFVPRSSSTGRTGRTGRWPWPRRHDPSATPEPPDAPGSPDEPEPAAALDEPEPAALDEPEPAAFDEPEAAAAFDEPEAAAAFDEPEPAAALDEPLPAPRPGDDEPEPAAGLDEPEPAAALDEPTAPVETPDAGAPSTADDAATLETSATSDENLPAPAETTEQAAEDPTEQAAAAGDSEPATAEVPAEPAAGTPTGPILYDGADDFTRDELADLATSGDDEESDDAAAAAAGDAGGADGAGGSTPPPGDDNGSRWSWVPRTVVGVLLVAVLAALGVTGYLLFRAERHEVPPMAGLEEEDARLLVEEFDWDVERRLDRSDDYPDAGQVIRTEPEPGEELAEGGQFLLVVSEGPEFRELPDLRELTRPEAIQRLEAMALSGSVTNRVYHEQIPRGQVVQWSVADDPDLGEGDEVLPGTEIELAMSRGPEPREVPDLLDMDPEEAEEALNDLRLETNRQPRVFHETIERGNVAHQRPQPGNEIERGETVVIRLSKGPDLVEFPDLRNLGERQARRRLNNAGFELSDMRGAVRQGDFRRAMIARNHDSPADNCEAGSRILLGTECLRGTPIVLVYLP